MTALHAARRRLSVALAALLLVLQGLAGGAVALAHASEQITAPVHIEAQHTSACVVLHDALRCALCQYAGSQVTPAAARVQTPDQRVTERRVQPKAVVPASAPDHLTPPSRAPPSLDV